MGRNDFLYTRFVSHFRHEPTPCQENMLRMTAGFIGSDDDIMIVNGYAGTGKTTAIAAVIATLKEFKTKLKFGSIFKKDGREKNTGWRIDYFVVSNELEKQLLGAKIHTEIMGSDHCPVELTMDID